MGVSEEGSLETRQVKATLLCTESKGESKFERGGSELSRTCRQRRVLRQGRLCILPPRGWRSDSPARRLCSPSASTSFVIKSKLMISHGQTRGQSVTRDPPPLCTLSLQWLVWWMRLEGGGLGLDSYQQQTSQPLGRVSSVQPAQHVGAWERGYWAASSKAVWNLCMSPTDTRCSCLPAGRLLPRLGVGVLDKAWADMAALIGGAVLGEE